MNNEELACFVQQIKQEDNSTSLSEFLSEKNPFLPQIQELFTKTLINKRIRNSLSEIFIFFFEKNEQAICLRGYTLDLKQYIQDAESKFLDQIWQGKVCLKSEKSSLKTYLYTVIKYIWVDIYRKHKRSKLRFNEGSLDTHKKLQEGYQETERMSVNNKSMIKETVMAMPKELNRVVLKMWIPYVFDYAFSPLEEKFLSQEKIEIVQLIEELRSKVEQLNTSTKYYISAQFIADKLQKKRNTVDMITKRFRERLQNRIQVKKEV